MGERWGRFDEEKRGITRRRGGRRVARREIDGHEARRKEVVRG
jgi:hypothetical protein